MEDFIESFQIVLVKLQGAADELWELVDQFSSSLVLRIEKSDDPIEAFKEARSVQATGREIRAALRSVVQPLKGRTGAFSKKIENFKLDVDKSARNCGINRLPDELLVNILDRTSYLDEWLAYSTNIKKRSFESLSGASLWRSVKLSHVCRRFRWSIRSSSVFWSGINFASLPPGVFGNKQNLTSDMPPSVIRGILERCDDTSTVLKAEIQPVSLRFGQGHHGYWCTTGRIDDNDWA